MIAITKKTSAHQTSGLNVWASSAEERMVSIAAPLFRLATRCSGLVLPARDTSHGRLFQHRYKARAVLGQAISHRRRSGQLTSVFQKLLGGVAGANVVRQTTIC